MLQLGWVQTRCLQQLPGLVFANMTWRAFQQIFAVDISREYENWVVGGTCDHKPTTAMVTSTHGDQNDMDKSATSHGDANTQLEHASGTVSKFGHCWDTACEFFFRIIPIHSTKRVVKEASSENQVKPDPSGCSFS